MKINACQYDDRRMQITLYLHLTEAEYQAINRQAKKAGVSEPHFIRSHIEQALQVKLDQIREALS